LDDVRRYGATVVFYAGEMLRPLVDAAPAVHDRHHPVRLFAGSGMRVDLWRRVVERFGTGVLEFYAATTENVVLANASGEKIGAIGRPLPGSTELDIVRFDLATRSPILDKHRRFERVAVDEPGIGIARIDPARVDVRVVRDALAPGDAWLVSHDLLRRDADGDIWFVDRIAGMVQVKGGFVSTRRIEDALYRLPEIQLAACIATPELIALVVTATPLDPARISRALGGDLALDLRPIRIRKITAMPMTEGFQPDRRALEIAAANFEDEVVLDIRSGDYART
jgi:putative long chain acyl-CoA synthase